MYIHVCVHVFEMYMYVTVGAKNVLVISAKAVDHVNNMGNRLMMEPEPTFLSPSV